jgi:hypothetical protein
MIGAIGLLGLLLLASPFLVIATLLILCYIRLGHLIDIGSRVSEQIVALGNIAAVSRPERIR